MKNEPGHPDLEQLKGAVIEAQIQQGLLHSIIMNLASDASRLWCTELKKAGGYSSLARVQATRTEPGLAAGHSVQR